MPWNLSEIQDVRISGSSLMANQLKMAMVNAILTLKQRGWSQRRIARELGIDRETVARYVHLGPADSKPATHAPTGSEDSKPANAPLGSGGRNCQNPARRVNANPFARLLRTNWKTSYPVSESTRTSETSMGLRAATTVSADLSNAWERIGRYLFAGWNVCPAMSRR